MTAVLYRCFDGEGRLLYIGSTSSWTRRIREHVGHSWWWQQIRRTQTEAHPTLEAARAAEAVAIQEEQPVINWRDAGRSWLSRRDAWTEADHKMHREWHEVRGRKPTSLTTFDRAAWRRAS